MMVSKVAPETDEMERPPSNKRDARENFMLESISGRNGESRNNFLGAAS
jgi:hypothetical protein